MKGRGASALIIAAVVALPPAAARAQSVQELQRQIDELKAAVQTLTAALAATKAAPAGAASGQVAASAAPEPTPAPAPVALASAAPAPATPLPVASSGTPPRAKAWYERIQMRGYTQLRFNSIISGDATAPGNRSRLRSVSDSGLNDAGNFSLRRVRLVFQGDLTDRISFYLQHDFATAVANQSVGERRETFGQLRDAYVDVALDRAKRFKLRFGQSKVPYGWENLQSSSNRLPLDRSDAINSAVPGERDLGVIAFYTPARVQRIWDDLGRKGQKLFGSYGAFSLGAFNGQGIARSEQNKTLMLTAMGTWPFRLDGLGDAFEGQVLELGASLMRNKVQPDIRTGGVSPVAFDDNRVGLHAILYPQPFGIQAEWNWGRGPEFDVAAQAIRAKKLDGGYVQTMYRVEESPIGPFMPYARWQRYRGGYKAAINAPRLETDEVELGVEWQPIKAIELTLAYARMKRNEADERRLGRAEGSVIRSQLQWNY